MQRWLYDFSNIVAIAQHDWSIWKGKMQKVLRRTVQNLKLMPCGWKIVVYSRQYLNYNFEFQISIWFAFGILWEIWMSTRVPLISIESTYVGKLWVLDFVTTFCLIFWSFEDFLIRNFEISELKMYQNWFFGRILIFPAWMESLDYSLSAARI